MPGNHLAPSALFHSSTWEGWEKALASVSHVFPPAPRPTFEWKSALGEIVCHTLTYFVWEFLANLLPCCLVHTIPDVFCVVAKTIPDRAFVHTHEQWFWREFCNKAKLCHTAPILKIVRPISDRLLSAALSHSVNRYSGRSGSKWVTATETHQDGSNYSEVKTTTPIWCLMCLNDLFRFCAVRWRSYCTG